MFAVNEPVVTAALHFIRNHLTESLKVERLPPSYSWPAGSRTQISLLVGSFRARRNDCAWVERAKELLASTNLPMSEAAKQSGFSSPQRMAIVFRKLTGRSPGDYRRHDRQRRPM